MPTGRPPKLGTIVGEDREGNPIHLEDMILSALRSGNYIEQAAAVAGINQDTIRDWVRIGQRAPTRAHKEHRRLTQHEQRCVAFSVALARAIAESEVYDATRIREAGLEPAVKRVTITKRVPVSDGDGKVTMVEQVEVREEVLPPDWKALAWRLERRFRERWGTSTSVEVTGRDGGPVVVDDIGARARALVDEVDAFNQGVQEGRVQLEATDG